MNHEASASAVSLQVAGDKEERFPLLEPKHKIFLSHSGAQKSFVADLDDALKRRDRYPFFDRSRSCLPVGEKYAKLIFDAIGQCDVGVVVLSEEFFTRSKWPMLELVAMVEESKKPNRRIKIIPVFYGISREECRDPAIQAKWMNECWIKWEEEDTKRRIDLGKWKSALGIFGSTTGLNMKDGRLDGELRAEIVEEVCKDVLPEIRWDDSKVEGKTRLCQEICKEVFNGIQPKDLRGGVRMVGLYGMGGIGKTTACKMLCNELCRDYCDRVCHVEFGSASELKLQRKALRMLSNLDGELLDKVYDVGVSNGYLRTHIVKERVFLALDNVSDESKEQAKSYLEVKLGDGSVVVMTARSMDQLQRLGVKREDCFAMPELELEEAKSLFLRHAGMEKNEVDQVLLEKCVRRCYFGKGQSSSLGDGKHYHPLALKVLGIEVGDLIREGDVATLVGLLEKIETFNLSRQKEHPVFSILRSSFDSLLEEDQLLFLHVALFLPKYHRPREIDYVCDDYALDYPIASCREWLCLVDGKKGDDFEMKLKCLKRRSLLESFGEYVDDFGMHDLWREFAAAEIEDGKLKDLHKFVECNVNVDLRGFSKMRVVNVKQGKVWWKDVALDVRGLTQLKSLEVDLRCFVHVEVKVNGLGTLESLSYLRCCKVASNACIAELGSLTNLQVVELLNFKGDKLPNMSRLTNLRKLKLNGSWKLQRVSLRNFPNLTNLHFGGCLRLQSLDISGCKSMRKLLGLDREYGDLALVELNVSSCPLLPSLGRQWNLRKLRKLDITGCNSIRELKWFGNLVALEEFRAMHCDSLTSLPSCRLPKVPRVLDIEPWKVPAEFYLYPRAMSSMVPQELDTLSCIQSVLMVVLLCF